MQALHQLRQRLVLRQNPTPLARVRHRPDQQMRAALQAPVRWRVGQLQPVPLRFLTGRVVDDRLVPAGRGRTRLAVRPQPVRTQPASEARVAELEAQLDDLVEQRGAPHMRVIDEPLRRVGQERPERIRCATGPLASDPVAGQLGPDGLAVMSQVLGDRRDRPTLSAERMSVHIVLPCEHAVRGSFEVLVEVRDRHPPRSPALRSDATQGCPKWGDSVSRSGEIQMSAITAK